MCNKRCSVLVSEQYTKCVYAVLAITKERILQDNIFPSLTCEQFLVNTSFQASHDRRNSANKYLLFANIKCLGGKILHYEMDQSLFKNEKVQCS